MPTSIEGEPVLNLGEDAATKKAFVSGEKVVERWTDPTILPQPYVQPADFAAQYPNPLDTTEILDLCEEVNLLRTLPEVQTGLSTYTWREMTSLEFSSGSSYIGFADGACPEEYRHDGSNHHVDIANIGVKKTLSVRDIKHSLSVAAGGFGIGALTGPFAAGEGMPGGADMGTFVRETVRDVKEKEVRLGMTLIMNGWDRLLVNGDSNTNPLEFDGIENWATNQSCTMHTNSNTASGTFSGIAYDRFLAEGCAKPQHIFGNPAAIQELMSAYFQLGFQGSQLVNFTNGNRITPGYNFSGFVNTGIGQLAVTADNNFRKTNIGGGAFQADIWALRMTQDGESLVHKITQIPLSYQDLTPGCTAVSFEIWAATALVIKVCCAQHKFTSQFSGRVTSTCTVIG